MSTFLKFLIFCCLLIASLTAQSQAKNHALQEAEQRRLQVEQQGGLQHFCSTDQQAENKLPSEDIKIMHRFSSFKNNGTWNLNDGYGSSCAKDCDLTDPNRTPLNCSTSNLFRIPVVYTLNTSTGCTTSAPSQAELDAQIIIMNDFMICQGIPMEFYQAQATRMIDTGCTYEAANVTNIPNVVNIYVFSNTGNGTACNGFASFPTHATAPTTTVMSYDCYNGFTYTQGTLDCNAPSLGFGLVLIHEMGHYFGLYHTHDTSTSGGGTCDDPTTSADDCNNGDLIEDTDADPDFSGGEIGCTNCDTGGANSSCSFDNSLPGCAAYGTPNTLNNVMGYNTFSGCRTSYTECQKAKIIDALLCARGPQMCNRDVTAEFTNGTTDTNKEICVGDPAPTFTASSSCYNWYDDLGATANTLISNSGTFTPTIGTNTGELDVNTPGTYTWYLGDLNEVNSNCRTAITVTVYADPGTATANGGMNALTLSGSQTLHLTTDATIVETDQLIGWWFTGAPLSFADQASLDAALSAATVGGALTNDPPNNIIKSTTNTPLKDLSIAWDCANFTEGNTYYATPIISKNDVPAPTSFSTSISPQSNISPTTNMLDISVAQVPANATLTKVCVTLDYNSCEGFATMNDLSMEIKSPNGTSIVLESFFPGSANVSTPTTIDFCFVDDGTGDDGSAACNDDCYSGSLESDNSFSAFDGLNPNGTWIFTLQDIRNASFYPCAITTSLEFDMPPTASTFPTANYSSCVLGSSVQINCMTQPVNLVCQSLGTVEVTCTSVSIADFVVQNTGSDNATASEVGYYLSTDQVFDNTDYLIGTSSVGALAPNATETENFSIDVTTVNPTIPNGTYYIGMVIDYNNMVTEGDETDNNNCSHATQVTITTDLSTPSVNVTSETCGGSDGSATVSFTGGTAPFTINWSTGATTNTTLSNLSAGNYTVSITDSNGCVSPLQNFSITNDNTSFTVTGVETHISCNGANNGAINLSTAGTTGTIEYQWSANANNATSEDVSGLAAGTYMVSVDDGTACQEVSSFTLTEPTTLTLSENITNASLCNETDGQIVATVGGGTAGYSYDWSVNSADGSNTASNLAAGTYTLTITDNNNCTITDSYTIDVTTPPSITVTTTTEKCGGANGSATIAISNGNSQNYTVYWDINGTITSGSNMTTINNLSAGNYSVYIDISGETGCQSATQNFTITNDNTNTLSISENITNASLCNETDGQIIATVGGGTAGYSYDWSVNSADGSNTASNLTAGTYTLTVTDNNSCTITDSYTIGVTTTPSITVTPTAEQCGGGDGSATIAISNGNSQNYTVYWDINGTITSGSNMTTINNLSAGNYSVYIDISGETGCQSTTQNFTITNNNTSALNISETITHVKCNNGDDGAITLNVTGNSGNVSYNWQHGPTSQTISGLSAGNYTVSVTDNTACVISKTFTITQPTALTISENSTNASLCNETDGQIIATVDGGTTGYSYDWSVNSADGSNTASNLTAGTYTLTVTDNNSCTITDSYTIGITTPPSITVTPTAEQCGGGDGSATITISNGNNQNYTVYWDINGTITSGSNMTTINNLSAGNYSVYIDISGETGCQSTTQNFTITNNNTSTLNISETITHVNCNNGDDGAITLNVTGNSGNVSYNWQHGPTSQTISGLSAGNYTVSVTDNTACVISKTFTITQPTALTISENITNASLCNETDGQIVATVGGGTAGYAYDWSVNSADGSNTASNLAAGTYTLTVTDNNNCTITDSYMVSVASPPSITNITTTPEQCNGNDGTLSFNISNGNNQTYTANIIDNNGSTLFTSTQNSFTGLVAGTYGLYVSNNGIGCNSAIVPFTIEYSNTSFLVTGVKTDITCNFANDGTIDLTTTNTTGTVNYNWSNSAISQDLNALATGIYTVTIDDATACQEVISFIINNPPLISTTTNITDATLCGATNGAINITPTGGTSGNGSYQLDWADPSISGGTFNTQQVSGLAAGSYNLSITDDNNCVEDFTINVGVATSPTITVNTTDTNCGSSNGAANISITNGNNQTYTAYWSNGQTTTNATSINGLAAGGYSVYIDNPSETGCQSTTIPFTINNANSTFSVTGTKANISCNGLTDGTINTTMSGSTTGNVNYTWSDNNITTPHRSNLAAGMYTVSVTDGSDCIESSQFIIVNPTPISGSISNITAPDCDESNGAFTLNITGGTNAVDGLYNFNWNTGGTNGRYNSQTVSNIPEGNYVITVTDDNNCMVTPVLSLVCNNTVPVTLVSFDISLQKNGYSLLEWEVSKEINFAHYLIQRSLNSRDWEDIGLQNATSQSTYHFIDKEVQGLFNNNRHVYYRLAMIDIDGSENISPIRSLYDNNSAAQWSLFPNPTTGSVTITGNFAQATNFIVSVINVNGQEVLHQLNNGTETQINLDLSNLSAGIYWIKIQSTKESWIEKVVRH